MQVELVYEYKPLEEKMPLMKSLNTIIVAMLETEREYDDGPSLHFYKHKDGDTQWILCYTTYKRLREQIVGTTLQDIF
ncbi:hypothetical protein [Bartonella sp. AD24XZML]